ncbi:IDEAL domain-containing protein [Saliterribacillus persicus]|uniref:IDEAL domain-containing protein n=1 Tax=Saliterribacillus persicus TaxID=930114 RepID=A0A368YA83_9BACI|nr:IDEAL domain-containing protein [Saliterribacillus persicus]RCW77035.1 IDEAL domain-containing protein [Saliterribacillus persicus]
MYQDFIAVKAFTHKVDCFCLGSIHSELLRIEQADIIRVTNERKYVANNGWYMMVEVDNQYNFYIALTDLERYYTTGQILLKDDIEFNINYLNAQVDRSLDNKDEALFKLFSTQLIEVSRLKVKLEKNLEAGALNYM